MKRVIVVGVLVLGLAGCGGSAVKHAAAETPGRSFPSTVAMIDAANAAGFRCQPFGKPAATAVSYRGQTCWHRAEDGAKDQIDVDVYTTQDQLDAATPYLPTARPGTTVVSGNLWSVTAATPGEARTLAEVLGGTDVSRGD